MFHMVFLLAKKWLYHWVIKCSPLGCCPWTRALYASHCAVGQHEEAIVEYFPLLSVDLFGWPHAAPQQSSGCAPCGGGGGTVWSRWLWTANKVWQGTICEDLSERTQLKPELNSDNKCTSLNSYQFPLASAVQMRGGAILNCWNKSWLFHSPSMTHLFYGLLCV